MHAFPFQLLHAFQRPVHPFPSSPSPRSLLLLFPPWQPMPPSSGKAGCWGAPHRTPMVELWKQSTASTSPAFQIPDPLSLYLPCLHSPSSVLPQLLSASLLHISQVPDICQVLPSSALSGCDYPRLHTGPIPFHRWFSPLLPLPTINMRSLCDSAFWCDRQHWGETT